MVFSTGSYLTLLLKACPSKYPFGSAEEMIYVHNLTNRSLGQKTLRIAIELVDVAPDCKLNIFLVADTVFSPENPKVSPIVRLRLVDLMISSWSYLQVHSLIAAGL